MREERKASRNGYGMVACLAERRREPANRSAVDPR
jgi:hypothetical protein